MDCDEDMWLKHRIKILLLSPVVIILLGLAVPAKMTIPVAGATRHDWNHQTFWDQRWGRSGVHKGIDIFAEVGRPVVSATYGIVVYKGERLLGGNTVAILGPKWRIHYYAHMKEIKTSLFSLVSLKQEIGTVGRTGNARKKPSHLHYSVMSLVPQPWRWDDSHQGWKKTFFLNPTTMLLPKNKIKMARKKRPPDNKTTGKHLAKNVY